MASKSLVVPKRCLHQPLLHAHAAVKTESSLDNQSINQKRSVARSKSVAGSDPTQLRLDNLI